MVELVRPQPGAVPTFRTESIDDATRRQRQMGDLAGAAANFALNYRNYASRRQVDRADTETALQYQADTESIFSKPYASAKELRDLGVDEDFMYEMAPGTEGPEKVDREEIALDEFQPLVTEKVLGRIIDANAQNITMGSERERWLNEKRRSMASVIMKQQGAAMEARFERAQEEEKRAINALLAAGMDDMAREQAKNFVDPAQRDALVLAVDKTSAVNQYNNVLQSRDPTAMREAAEAVISDSRLSEPEQTAMQNQLLNTASSLIGTASKERVAGWDRQLAAIDAMFERDPATAYQMAIEFHTFLDSQGRVDYVGTQWLATRAARAETALMEIEKQQTDEAAVRAMMYAPIPVTMDTDMKQAADRIAEEELATAGVIMAETGDPQSVQQALDYITGLTISTGYIPTALQGMFNGVDKPTATADQAQAALAQYNRIADQAPWLLEQIPESQRVTLSLMRSNFLTGQYDPESFQAVKAQLMNVTPEVRVVRDREVKSIIRNGKTRERFSNMTANRHPTLGKSWYNLLGSDPQLGTKVQLAYDNAYTKYYTLTGDPEASEEAAYNEVWSTYKPTEVNGRQEVWRDAPEIRYNMTSEQIRSDLEHWMSTNTDYSGEMDNIKLMENVDTPYHTGTPQYSLLVVNPETGITEPLMDSRGVHITWKPDHDSFTKRERDKAVAAAKKEREFQERLEAERKSGKQIPQEILDATAKPRVRLDSRLPGPNTQQHPLTGQNIRDLPPDIVADLVGQ